MNIKRIITLVLPIVLTLSVLSGCGIDNDNITNKGQTSNLLLEKNISSSNSEFDYTKVAKQLFFNMVDDGSKGRLSGSEENLKIGEGISQYFRDIGLEPFENNSYFHEYEAPVFANRDEKLTQLDVIIGDETSALVFGQDYMINNTIEDVSCVLPVTDDYTMDKEKQKKYLYISDSLLEFNKTDNLFAGSITIRNGDMHATNARMATDGLNIRVTEQIHKKIKENVANGKEVKISVKAKANVKTEKLKNVVGKINGQSSEKALFVTAHFDGLGYLNEKVFNGAIDNASGTLTMLMVAQDFASKYNGALIPPYDIYFVAFNSEEIGITGSEAFAKEMREKYSHNIVNINIDCVSETLTLGTNSEKITPLMQELKSSLVEDGIPCEDEEYLNSDHASFLANGATAFTLGDISSNQNYDIVHTTKDTVDKVDVNYCKKVSRAISNYSIRKGGKIFDYCVSLSNQMSNVDMQKLHENAEVKMKELSLKSNEYYDYYDEEWKTFIRITGQNNYTDINKFAKVFPKEKVNVENVPRKLNGLKFYSIQVRTKDISSNYIILPADYSGVLDKVISVDMSKEEIESLIIVYGESNKDKNTMSETITVTITPKEPFRIEGEDEKVIVNGREYQFLRSLSYNDFKASDYNFGSNFFNRFSSEMDGYFVEIKFSQAMFFDSIVAESSDSIKLDKQEMTSLVKKLNDSLDMFAKIV